MTSAQICIMIAIIVYLIGMIYIGFRCSKKNNSTDDFYLGWQKTRSFRNRDECRSFRHEQLASDGTSGALLTSPEFQMPDGQQSDWLPVHTLTG